MDIEQTTEHRVARVFGLEGDAWMRHANPRSVWSRFSCLSLIALAIWSREWIGWWSVVPLAASVVWMVVNPRFFGVPASTRNWASRGVFGERIWADRTSVEIPPQFTSSVPTLTNVYGTLGLGLMTYGLVAFDAWLVVSGILIVHATKLWYIDRMVLLYEDMKLSNPEYAAWEHGA